MLIKILNLIFLFICLNSVVCNDNNNDDNDSNNNTSNVSISLSDNLNSRQVPKKQVSHIQHILYTTEKNNSAPIVSETVPRNVLSNSPQAQDSTDNFRPSVPLGEIKHSCDHQVRKTQSTPFNHAPHIQFDNSINAEPEKGTVLLHPQQSITNPIKFVHDTDSRYAATPTVAEHQGLHNPYHQSNYQEGYVPIDVTPQVAHVSQVSQTQPIHYEPEQHQFHHNYHNQHYNEPSFQTLYTKPIKHEPVEPVHYHYAYAPPVAHEEVVASYTDSPTSSFQSYYLTPTHHENPGYYNEELINPKPGAVVYVTSHRQTSITKTRKFPYKYYQPPSDTVIHPIEPEHTFAPVHHKPVSPWHKILHLIGAFLPLGLLIAALKPPIIKIDSNNTKPDIVLSKLKPFQNYLPIEHRSLEESDDNNNCENKSICELILQGANENAEFAHKLLWNFSVRWTEEEAKRNDLEDLYKAVKKKNCNTIKC